MDLSMECNINIIRQELQIRAVGTRLIGSSFAHQMHQLHRPESEVTIDGTLIPAWFEFQVTIWPGVFQRFGRACGSQNACHVGVLAQFFRHGGEDFITQTCLADFLAS